MNKHREAYEAFQTIFNYTQRKCKNCIFSIKGIKDEDFCVFEGCPGVFVSDYLNEDIRKRVEELERQEVERMSEKNIMGGWDKAIEKIIDMEEVGRMIKPIKEPQIGQYNCHGGDKTDCKHILKERCDFMYRNIDELEDGECIVLKVVVYNQGGKMQMVNEKELREYEKGTDFFDILADPKLLCLYDDGE